MFSIEHDFDSTVITLVDEGAAPLGEDVVIRMFDDHAELVQYPADSDTPQRVILTLAQLRDLAAALDLPEGVYQLVRAHEG